MVGKTFGSATMTVVGTISTAACALGDIIVSPTGVGELVTVPATAYSLGVTAVSGANTANNVNNLIMKATQNGNGSSGTDKASLNKFKNNKEANKAAQNQGYEGAE